ncbi:MAG: hypothetical protein SWY16_26700, partial [Cyanobacteriota bacterium]|nr:hypothetical protein [Cyanobacteriota bacterium]
MNARYTILPCPLISPYPRPLIYSNLPMRFHPTSTIAFLLLLLTGCTEPPDRDRLPQANAAIPATDERRGDAIQETAFAARSLAVREQLASQDLAELDSWWRRENIGDPHKYLLPAILAQLSLDGDDEKERDRIWDYWLQLERERPDLYHFRSLFDTRIFFLFRDELPPEVEAAYRTMLAVPRADEWNEGGTENHISQQFLSGLTLMDGSGFPVAYPHQRATHEAWLRAELNKFLTIGQGEFHSSTYYGYTIGSLLNLYDFAETPHLRQLAGGMLDWLAANTALRQSWGTTGGAESRGFDRGTWETGLSAVAWIWWGDEDPEEITRVAERMPKNAARLALLAGLSGYRPPQQLRSLARKEVPLPFLAQGSHPVYYGYREGNQFWETFYATEDYTVGTLLDASRSYQVQGTIRAQHATYKLVVRDRDGMENGQQNAVISLAGTYHSPMATGRSPGDRYLQGRSATILQLILNSQDIAAGVPARSHLVLPQRYGEPQRHGDWYFWQIENTWLCARPWGDSIEL